MTRISAAKHEEYAEERRSLILNAALQVFAQMGFAEATMDQVAKAANMSKAAVYLYFRSKEELLERLIQRYALLPEFPDLVESIRETPPLEGIPTLTAEVWRRLRERKELAHVLVREIQSSPKRAKLFYEHAGLRAFHSLAAYLECWMKRGALRRQDSLAAAQCLFGMLWSFFLTQELIGGKELHPLSDEKVIKTVAQMFLSGAANIDRNRLPKMNAGFSQPL